MARNAQIVDVLIASPGDAATGRDAIERALHDWNTHRSDSSGLVLRPRRWETGSVPLLGRGDGQTIINQQLVDRADIVFAIFYHKVGTTTSRALSGTVEEIRRSVSNGKPVHLYFADMQRPSDADLDQLILLRDLRKELQGEGLVGTFRTEDELQRLVASAIEYDLSQMQDGHSEDQTERATQSEFVRTRQDAAQPAYQPPGNLGTPPMSGPGPVRDHTVESRQNRRGLSEKQKLWVLTVISLAGVIFLTSIGPKPPEPAPSWVAVPGVLLTVSFLFAIVKLVIIKILELRRRSSAGS